jgi:hypothetical protein
MMLHPGPIIISKTEINAVKILSKFYRGIISFYLKDPANKLIPRSANIYIKTASKTKKLAIDTIV